MKNADIKTSQQNHITAHEQTAIIIQAQKLK